MKARETRSSPALPARSGPVKRWWLDRSVRVKGMIVVAGPLIALIAVSSASLVLQYNERQERSVAVTASAVNTSAQQVLADAVNAETGVRGYAETGDPRFLQPYDMSRARLGSDSGAFSAAAVAERDGHGERIAVATLSKEMAALGRLRSEVRGGVSGAALKPALENGKHIMDALRSQIAALARGPAAIALAHRAAINRLESVINAVSIAGLALGLLTGLIGVALFTSGISGRVTVAAANAGRLGEGQPLETVPGAADELGRLADSLERAEEVLASRTEDLVAARDEAVTATHAKNAFLSSTSHELRTPLNAVLGFAQLLQMSDLDQEDQDAVERILAAGRHLLALINELIDIARIESGEFSLSVEPVSLQPVVEETCQLVATLAADRSITISQLCSSSDVAVSADRQRLSQILVNLLSNAIKYNRAGGTITITCQAVGPGQVNLAVADTGPGIPAADLGRIFDPFERLGAEQTAVEGTGIGLPLARAFAEAMHGRLTAASVVGEGTTFTLILPRAHDMAEAPADRSSVAAAGPARSPHGDMCPHPVHRGQPSERRGRHPVHQDQAWHALGVGHLRRGWPGGRDPGHPRPHPPGPAPARPARQHGPAAAQGLPGHGRRPRRRPVRRGRAVRRPSHARPRRHRLPHQAARPRRAGQATRLRCGRTAEPGRPDPPDGAGSMSAAVRLP